MTSAGIGEELTEGGVDLLVNSDPGEQPSNGDKQPDGENVDVTRGNSQSHTKSTAIHRAQCSRASVEDVNNVLWISCTCKEYMLVSFMQHPSLSDVCRPSWHQYLTYVSTITLAINQLMDEAAQTKNHTPIVLVEKKVLMSNDSMLVELICRTTEISNLSDYKAIFSNLQAYFCGFSAKHVKKACKKIRERLGEDKIIDDILISDLAPVCRGRILLETLNCIENVNESVKVHLNPANPEWDKLPQDSIFMKLAQPILFKRSIPLVQKRIRCDPLKMTVKNTHDQGLAEMNIDELLRKWKGDYLGNVSDIPCYSEVQLADNQDDDLMLGDGVAHSHLISNPSPEKITHDANRRAEVIKRGAYMNWRLLENIMDDNVDSGFKVMLKQMMGGGDLAPNPTPIHWLYSKQDSTMPNHVNDMMWSLRYNLLNENWGSLVRDALVKPVCTEISFQHLSTLDMGTGRVAFSDRQFRNINCKRIRAVWRVLFWSKLEGTLKQRGLNTATLLSMHEYINTLVKLTGVIEIESPIPAVQEWYSSLLMLGLCLPEDDLEVLEELRRAKDEFASVLDGDNWTCVIELVLWAHGVSQIPEDTLVSMLVKGAPSHGLSLLVCAVYVLHRAGDNATCLRLLSSYEHTAIAADLPAIVSMLKLVGAEKQAHDVIMILEEHQLDPSHTLMVDHCVERLASANLTATDIVKVIAILMEFLDFACNKDHQPAWELLKSTIEDLMLISGEVENEQMELFSCLWDERNDWWPRFHASPIENPLHSMKTFVISTLQSISAINTQTGDS